jgi:hypothetical protein
VVVDVGAVERWAFESSAGAADVWPYFIDAARRSRRRLLWVVAPTVMSSPGVTRARLDAIKADLVAAACGDVIRSHEPLPSLARAEVCRGDEDLGLITAGIDDRSYELSLLDLQFVAILDVGTGRLWSYGSAYEELGEPLFLPQIDATVGVGVDGRSAIVKEASSPGNVDLLREASRADGPIWSAPLPDRPRGRLLEHRDPIERRASELTGDDARPDWIARKHLSERVRQACAPDPGTPGTAYVMADVHRADGGGLEIERVDVLVDGTRRLAVGPEPIAALLGEIAASHPRWFGPRVMDLLAWAADNAVAHPTKAMDPALLGFLANPDSPMRLELIEPDLASMSPVARTWLADHTRTAALPAEHYASTRHALLPLLPRLDRVLSGQFAEQGGGALLSDDIEPTLPILARIERRGVWVDPASAARRRLRVAIHNTLSRLEQQVAPLLGTRDPYTTPVHALNAALADRVELLPAEDDGLKGRQRLARLAAAGVSEAVALRTMKSLCSTSGVQRWLDRLGGGATRLRGRHVPLATGRFSMRDPPLHGVPKRSREARILRRAFEGPPGYELIDADWNSFEARVLAALSKDPILLAATSSSDMIQALIGLLGTSGPLSRQQVKVALYSYIYGQSRDGFWRAQPTMMRAEAEALYDLIGSTLTTMASYRDDVLKRWKKDRCIRTIGGWYRAPRTKRSAFSTMIQGSAADLLRWVLRRLEQVLPAGAVVVHQVHDQLIVAVPPADAMNVEQILLDVMQRDIVTMCPFYPKNLVLRANVHRGRSWRDLL